MASKSWIARSQRVPKFRTRAVNRCQICGRGRAYYRRFKMCRICLRNLAARGEIAGLHKASW